MPKAWVDTERPDRIALETQWHQRDLVKEVPGTTYDKDRRIWTLPLSWGSCLALRGTFGQELTVEPSLVDWATRHHAEHVAPVLALRELLEPPDGVVEDGLDPFQEVFVRCADAAERILHEGEMGTGKTVAAVRSLARWIKRVGDEALPALIVAPNATTESVWMTHLARWLPEVPATLLKTAKDVARVDPRGIAVVNWEKLRTLSRLAPYGSVRLKKCQEHGGADPKVTARACEVHPKELNTVAWATVMGDEVHHIKDPKAKQTRAFWHLAHRARFRLGGSGTSIANHAGDLWPILHAIAPEDWPSRVAFIERYCEKSYNRFGGLDVEGLTRDPARRAEFYAIFEPRSVRQLKAQVLPYLPEKVFETRLADMPAKQRRAYDQMERQMLSEVEGGLVVATTPLAVATRLSQFASAYAELNGDGEVRLALPSCKVDALLELVEELGDEQLVVFAQSRQLIELCELALARREVTYTSVRGKGDLSPGVDVGDADLAVRRFQEGDVRLLLATYAAGGEGLTMHAASTMIRLQRTYDAVKDAQAEDRIHRRGQTAQSCLYIDVQARDTTESRIPKALETKGGRLEEIGRDKDLLRRVLGGK